MPFPPPEDFPDPGIELASLRSPALASMFFTTSATWEALKLRCDSKTHICTLLPIFDWAVCFSDIELCGEINRYLLLEGKL